MKTILKAIVFYLAIGCTPLYAQDTKKGVEEVCFNVSMSCHNCQNKIEKNIPWEKGVKDLKVNLEEKTVTIKYDAKKTTVEKLKTALEGLDFTCSIATDVKEKEE